MWQGVALATICLVPRLTGYSRLFKPDAKGKYETLRSHRIYSAYVIVAIYQLDLAPILMEVADLSLAALLQLPAADLSLAVLMGLAGIPEG